MKQPIADCVSDGGIADVVVPFFDGELAGQDGGPVAGQLPIKDWHAYLKAARYSNQLTDDNVDWEILRERDFRRSDDDPGKIERYQAEALVHGYMPADALSGLVCQRSAEQSALETEVGQRGHALKVIAKPNWYFG